jgi:hypothetical protein
MVQLAGVCFFNPGHALRIRRFVFSTQNLLEHVPVVPGEDGNVGNGCLPQ